MHAAIRDGVRGSSMVAYGRRLDEATIDALVDFIQVQFMGKSMSSKTVSQTGQEVYEQHCAVCHGDKGSSAVWAKNGLTPPPRDFTSQASKNELSRERMLLSVTHGRPGTAMMPFSSRLSEQQIEAVVDFIRQIFMQSDSSKSDKQNITQKPMHQTVEITQDSAQLYPGMLTGDPQKGESFYQSNCYVCHGKTGGGDGPRAYFNRPRPRDFTTPLSQKELTRSRLFQSISQGRRGSVMPAWSTVLTDQQIADVAEYVYQSFLHPQKKKH
jgi:mono/diheme cytochrome c family protein